MKIELEPLDKRLLNLVQREIGLVPRPFAAVADELGVTQTEVLDRLRRWRDEAHYIRQISAIFDTRKLGYRSMLVAMKIPPEKINRAGQIVNRHPGVSHNYERDNAFNLWFTVAVPPGMSLERHVERLHELCEATSTRLLPTLKMFKIEVRLDMETGVSNADAPPHVEADAIPPTDDEIQAIRALQVDMPIVERPFAAMAEREGLTEDEVLAYAHRFVADGRLRRCAAILRHRQAGFISNGMGVWRCPEERAAKYGTEIASHPEVTHCYQRPTYEDWPYRIFSMVHARTEDMVRDAIHRIAADTGLDQYDVLFSTREFKKTRVPYFTGEYEAWETEYLGGREPVPAS